MYELGIADALLGANRTIILADENTKIEKLAFDINHKRISRLTRIIRISIELFGMDNTSVGRV